MRNVHGAAGPKNLESRVECQEGLQEVLLCPKTEIVHHELPGIIGGQKHVMHMHHDSGMQAREDLQVLIEDIAADGDDVARVEEEDIAVTEAVEELQWDLLRRPFDEAGEPGEILRVRQGQETARW